MNLLKKPIFLHIPFRRLCVVECDTGVSDVFVWDVDRVWDSLSFEITLKEVRESTFLSLFNKFWVFYQIFFRFVKYPGQYIHTYRVMARILIRSLIDKVTDEIDPVVLAEVLNSLEDSRFRNMKNLRDEFNVVSRLLDDKDFKERASRRLYWSIVLVVAYNKRIPRHEFLETLQDHLLKAWYSFEDLREILVDELYNCLEDMDGPWTMNLIEDIPDG